MNRGVSVLLLSVLLTAGLVQAGPFIFVAHGDEGPDRYDARPDEWEKQVAQDARGDVLVTWPGSIDLLYMTMGNLHSSGRGETFLFIRIGYNITTPGGETIPVPNESPSGLLPDPPGVVDDRPVVRIDVSFNVTHGDEVRRESLTLVSDDYGRTWASDQGLLVTDNPLEDRNDREVLYAAPIRRFEIETGDVLSDYNVSSHRNERLVDTMHGFDAANDYLPNYVPVHPLLQDPTRVLPPLPVPPPEPPQPPEDVPVPDPTDTVPNEPYPVPPGPGGQGIPRGVPDPRDLEDWDPDRDGPVPWDLEDVAEGVSDPESGAAWTNDFTVESGTSRFIVRAHQEVVRASIEQVGFGNFTVDSLMTETDQLVGLFWSGPPGMRWLMRYGLDMPSGMKTLPADGRVEMSIIAAPESLFSRPFWGGMAVFISDWGGIEFVPVILQSTSEPLEDPRQVRDHQLVLPDNPRIQVLNPESDFRANERRNLIVQVRDEDTGLYVSQLRGVRAFIYPEGAAPGNLPYQLREKPWMDGVYEVGFVFDRPGAWHVQVYIFDYPPDADGGGWPHEAFVVRVEYQGESVPLMPLGLALASVVLIVSAVWARERISKSR